MFNPQTFVKQIYSTEPKESLSGYFLGKKVSDIEERSCISLSKLKIPFTLQARINPLMGITENKQNLPSEVEIDLLAEYQNTLFPININGEIAHMYASWQKVRDAKKEIIINAALKPYNAHKLIVVPYWKLVTQEMSDRFYAYNFANAFPTEFYETM
jgi:hypothetical protein